EAARASSRALLEAGDRFVLAYSGSLNSWYCEEEMARFYAVLRKKRSSQLVVFTRSPADRLRAALRRTQIPDGEMRIEAVSPPGIPSRLADADAAISFIQPYFSKMTSSPTKIAEYL